MTDFSLLFSRRGFLGKVFLTLIFQLIITFCVVFTLSKNEEMMKKMFNWWVVFVVFLVMIGLLFAIVSSHLSISVKMLLFTVFSVAFGVLLSPIGLINRDVLLAAAGGTLGIFVAMFLAGAVLTAMKIDLSLLGAILLACLIGLLIATLVSFLFGLRRQHIAWVYIGLVVYSLFVMFDTQTLLVGKYQTDFVAGAMSYYLDVIGIFIRLVEIFARSQR